MPTLAINGVVDSTHVVTAARIGASLAFVVFTIDFFEDALEADVFVPCGLLLGCLLVALAEHALWELLDLEYLLVPGPFTLSAQTERLGQ